MNFGETCEAAVVREIRWERSAWGHNPGRWVLGFSIRACGAFFLLCVCVCVFGGREGGAKVVVVFRGKPKGKHNFGGVA